ncbi:MAG TPA: NAD-dependent epimerase/dehydratase family protein [Caldimonas sp.]|jgi:2'-hydroxyisoflavone reductase|nr:NAD-dependent epimerase/dehydratase family protein [Caldimonas sp.]HEV7578003.1 NAD-dependent epimerase/dehydratase family protein [Caldimonas sp.]
MSMKRRDFLQTAAALGAIGALSRAAFAADGPKERLRILILGGTGFTGPHQVRYALERGHHVTLFNRGRRPQPWPGDVVELTGDRNTGDLRSLETGEWDVCIDNPTTLPFWVRDAGRVLQGRVRQFVFISTVSAYAANDKVDQDESALTAAYQGVDAMAETQDTLRADMALYGPLKAASEAEARRWFGAATTVIRPGLIVGPGDETDRFTYWPVRLARGGEVLAPGDGSDPVQFIDARDLAEWTIRMAESRTTGTFNATGPAARLTTREMLVGIGAGVRSDAPLTWVPTSFLEKEKVQAWSDLPVWVPGEGDSVGFARRDIGRALRAGLTFRPLATTAAETLAWFRDQPAARQAKPRTGLTPEREAEVLAQWKASTGGKR